MTDNLAPCPLCGSPAVAHVDARGRAWAASCTGKCILHIDYQDETNRHVPIEEWPKIGGRVRRGGRG
jgi:hypothetical protein